MPSITANRVHFEDYSGENFERLVLAYHLRDDWQAVEWYGQTGSDQGRDIVGVQPVKGRRGRRTVIQCANRSVLTFAKCQADMRAACGAPSGVPDAFKIVSRANVTAPLRDRIREAGKKLGIKFVTVWSGVDFEEHLRLRAEPLLQRFVNGVEFPDSAADLRRFVDDFPALSERDKFELLAAVLDRPAFKTPIHSESSITDMRQAIADTIEALNTGRWRDRQGGSIRDVPARHTFQKSQVRVALADLTDEIDAIRHTIVRRIKDGSIKPCGCGNANCPVHTMAPETEEELDLARRRVLRKFDAVRAQI